VAKVQLEIPGSNVKASIPVEALESIAGPGAVAVVTVFSEEELNSFRPVAAEGEEEPAQTLAAQPVSIRLLNDQGEEISIFDLEEPISVELEQPDVEVGEGEELRCAFWDEENSVWITEGMSRDESDPDRLVCVTTHLTVFGAVIQGALGALQCGNVEILTEKGLNRMWKGDWYLDLTAVLWWLLLIFQGSIMVYFTLKGWQRTREVDWREEDLLTDNDAYRKKKSVKKRRVVDESSQDANPSDDEDAGPSMIEDVKKLLSPSGIASACAKVVAENSLAVQQRVNAEDLKVILMGAKKTKKRKPQAGWDGSPDHSPSRASGPGTLKRGVTSGRVTRQVHDIPIIQQVSTNATGAFSSFFQASFTQRVWILFNALNAWISLRHFSFTLPQTTRALLLICRVQGSLFVSAFFFQGTASDKSSDPACNPSDFWGKLGFNIIVSIFAFIFGSVPYIIMVKLSLKKFVYREEWDDEAKERYLFKWRMQAWGMWLVAATYVAFCTVFVTAFLANVAEGAEIDWLTTATIDLFLELFLRPLFVAILLASIIQYAQSRNPSLVQDQVNIVQRSFKVLTRPEDAPDSPTSAGASPQEKQQRSLRMAAAASEEMEDVAPHRGMFSREAPPLPAIPAAIVDADGGAEHADDDDYDPNDPFGLNMPPPLNALAGGPSEMSGSSDEHDTGPDLLTHDDFGFLRTTVGSISSIPAMHQPAELPPLPPVAEGRADDAVPLPPAEGFRLAPLPRISPLYVPRPHSPPRGKPLTPEDIPADLPLAPPTPVAALPPHPALIQREGTESDASIQALTSPTRRTSGGGSGSHAGSTRHAGSRGPPRSHMDIGSSWHLE